MELLKVINFMVELPCKSIVKVFYNLKKFPKKITCEKKSKIYISKINQKVNRFDEVKTEIN